MNASCRPLTQHPVRTFPADEATPTTPDNRLLLATFWCGLEETQPSPPAAWRDVGSEDHFRGPVLQGCSLFVRRVEVRGSKQRVHARNLFHLLQTPPEWYSYEVESSHLLIQAQRLQALAQAGLAYATNPYDLERYAEIRTISVKLLQELTEEPLEKIIRVFASEDGYQTPKVDIRAVLFREGPEILLVREKVDNGKWTLPGGWADIGYTPFEVATKEAYEETGLIVKPLRLLALFDKRKHPHPPQPWYVYKAFIECEVQGGSLIQDTPETRGARWFRCDELPYIKLSTDRTTASQLETIFRFASEPRSPTLCD